MALGIKDYLVPGKESHAEGNRTVLNMQCEKPVKRELCLDLSSQSLLEVSIDMATEPRHLQFLFLQSNQIESLPSNFFLQLPSLRHLDLRENRLVEIPASIAGHDNLQVLLLQNNKLPTLPCELGQVPRLRKLQFSGNPISWPPAHILSKGLDAILSFLREAYMEQLSHGVIDMIPKANDYECTKDGEDYANMTSGDTKTQDQSQKSLTLYKEKFIPPSANSFESLQKKKTKLIAQEELKEKSVSELILLKGNSKLLKNRTPSLRFNTASNKDIKGPSLQPVISGGHAQAIMNGQSFPLGYRKRTASSSTTKIYKTLLKKLWLNQLKCVLQSQDQALQKQKTSEALRQWRQEARTLRQTASHHNWPGIDFPYDFDSNYMKMVTRSGWQMFQNKSLEKRGHEKPNQSCVRAMGLQDKINQILLTFEEVGSSKSTSFSQSNTTDPSTQRKLLAEEMKRISDLQKAVQALRLSM